MNAAKRPKPPRLSLGALSRIDKACDRFEESLHSDRPLSIEELIAGVEGVERQQLLLQLLKLDLEYQNPADLKEAEAGYRRRFPTDRAVIRKAIEKHRESNGLEFATASLITFAPAESPEHDTTLTMAKLPASIPPPLRSLEDYALLQELGRGGMGIVYHARHRQTRREVAIKMLLTGAQSTKDQIKRFLREARTASKLQHPNIVAVQETGFCDGAPYFVMDYVDGLDLESLAHNSPLTQMEAALLIKTAARAIEYAHTHDVVHRDIKPSNLLLDEEVRLRITDFGLARELSQGETLTQTGNVLGTPAYMPPEQALANRQLIGPRSDVYSLGAVLFFLLTGRPPFQGDAVVRVLHLVVTTRPPNPRTLDNSISKGLASICLKCLEKNPDRRYQSAAALADDLERWQRMKPVAAEQPVIQSLERKISPERQRPIPKWTTLITAFACLLIAGILMIPGRNRPQGAEIVGLGIVGPSTAEPGPVEPGPVEPGPVEPGPVGPIVNEPFIEKGCKHEVNDSVAYFAPHSHPFGVGKVSFYIDPALKRGWKWYSDQPARIVSNNESARVLYQSFEFEESTKPGGHNRFTGWFLIKTPPETNKIVVDLFAGDTTIAKNLPLTLTRDGDEEQLKRVLDEWWTAMITNRRLNDSAEVQLIPSTEVQLVNDFFLNMLMRRWNEVLPRGQHLELPDAPEREASSDLEQQFEWMVGMLLGFESIRLAMMDLPPLKGKERARNPIHQIPELFPPKLPATNKVGMPWQKSLAWHVPRECFSLRCISVKNYLWVRDVVQGWGGNLDEIVAVPAVDDRIRDRIERQLAFYPNLADDNGIDDLLKDCALIGLDPYFHDGAAVGILFQANAGANQQLSDLLNSQRENAQREFRAEMNNDMTIGGQPASLLFTPQHRIRSFYIQSGDCHLITNSQALAALFVETSEAPTKSLASLEEYQTALSHLDNPNGYAGVLYVPSPFIENITSPEYVIEVARRRRAVRELQLLGLAVQAAQAEQFEFNRLVDLKGRFLQKDFGIRQNSLDRPVLEGSSVCFDNERGYPGTFLPIADNPISMVTDEEAKRYDDFKTSYRAQWDTPQPVLLTFASDQDDAGTNQVVIDIRLTPFAQQKYSLLAQFLPDAPQKKQFTPLDNELLSVSLSTFVGPIPAYFHLGLIDERVDSQIANGAIRRLGEFQELQFAEKNYYFFLSPFSLIEILDKQFGLQDLAKRSGLEPLFRNIRIIDAAAVSSRDVGIINQVEDHIKNRKHFQVADQPAHFLLQLKDVKKSKVIEYMREYTFITGRQTSAANAAVLNRMSADLGLSPEDAKSQLEQILGGQELEPEEEGGGTRMTQLQCPAGGVYVLNDPPDASTYWTSTGWQAPSVYLETKAPDNYEYPFLNWVQELSLGSTLESNTQTLKSHLELTLRKPPDHIDGHRPEDFPRSIEIKPRGSEPRERIDGPVVNITNQSGKMLYYRYGHIKGSMSEWMMLKGKDPVPLRLDQPLVLQYRTTGHTRRMLVGAKIDLNYTKEGWEQVR